MPTVQNLKTTVEPLSESVLEAYMRLLPNQADSLKRGRLSWRFKTAPASQGVFSITRDSESGAIVGINAYLAVPFLLRGKKTFAHQSMDTIVDPACRGQGLFTRQINAFYAAAASIGGALLYGFPNKNSAPGFFGKLGWTKLPQPPFLLKPLRSGYFVERLLGKKIFDFPLSFCRRPQSSRIVTLTRFDKKADMLWQAFSQKIVCGVYRDSDYLNWRIFDHPETPYTTKAVLSEDGATMEAFVTFTVQDKHGGKIGYIMEAMGLPDKPQALHLLLKEITADCAEAGADVILAWAPCHAPNYKTLRKNGYWPLPEKLRPIELNFGYRAFAAEDAPKLTYQDWYISYLDSDTV